MKLTGNCKDNYLAVRVGSAYGRVVERFCRNNITGAQAQIFYNKLFLEWRTEDPSSNYFSLQWMAPPITCCTNLTITASQTSTISTAYLGNYLYDQDLTVSIDFYGRWVYSQPGGENCLWFSWYWREWSLSPCTDLGSDQ